MEAVRTEGTPWSTLAKATAPTSAASEQDSGFSDTSSEHHSVAESRDGGVRHGLGSGGDRAGARAQPQAVAQTPGTFAQPGLHSFYILKNVFINQPLCMTSDPQVMHAQLKAWGGDHSQILLVPGPPLAAPHEQPQPQQPQQPQPPPACPQPQAKTSGYLPIFNSYQRIAPRPGKAECVPPESAMLPPPPPLSPPPPPSASPPPPPAAAAPAPAPPLCQGVGDGGARSGKRPRLANGEAARGFSGDAGTATPTPQHQHQRQQRSKRKGGVLPVAHEQQLASPSKRQHAPQRRQHQRHHHHHQQQKQTHGHGRSRHRHRHAKRSSRGDRAPLSQRFTTLVSLLNSGGPSVPVAADARGAAVDAPAPRSPAAAPRSPEPTCAPVAPLCDDELQTMDFLDEVLPLGPEGVAAMASGHAQGGDAGGDGERSGEANALGDGAGSSDGSSSTAGGDHQQRFHNTVSILSRSGLLDITMRTKDLLRRNGQAQRELEELRRAARLFCRAARSSEPSAWENLREAMAPLGAGDEPVAPSLPGSPDAGFVARDGGGGGGGDGGGGNAGEACLPWAALADAACQAGLGVVSSWAA